MTDVLQIAEQRRADYKAAITKREREIEELRTRIAELDDFLEFGQMLVEEKPQKAKEPGERKFDAVDAGSDDADDTREQARTVHLERTPGGLPQRGESNGLSSAAGA